MPTVIRIKNLIKQFGDNRVLDNISLDIQRGEIFGVIGMSGSGKTTLLNCLVGYNQAEEGDVLFQSSMFIDRSSKNMESIHKDLLRLRKIFGFAPQLPSFYMQLTAGENLSYFSDLYGIPKKTQKANIDSLLSLTGLSASKDALAMELSGGMQKRLGIACALAHKPDILILDEPTADLDPILRGQTWNLIRKINKQGTTVIIASHFIEEIESLCDKIGVLHNGKLLTLGSPLKLKDVYTKNDEIHLETSSRDYKHLMSKLKTRKSLGINKIHAEGKKLVIYTEKATDTFKFILHSLGRDKIVSADINRPTLREVFEALATGQKTLRK